MKIKHVELNIVSIEVMRHTVVELPATRRYKTGLDVIKLDVGKAGSKLLASLTKFMLLQKRKRRVNSDRRTTD